VAIQPYLFFDGRCEEAIDFYRGTLGAEVEMLMRFKESPEPPPPGMVPPGFDDKVMHASFRVAGSTVMATDGGGCQGGPAAFRGFALSLTVADEAEADRVFAALGEGGEVRMPLGKTFFAPRFGMVSDRFGVTLDGGGRGLTLRGRRECGGAGPFTASLRACGVRRQRRESACRDGGSR